MTAPHSDWKPPVHYATHSWIERFLDLRVVRFDPGASAKDVKDGRILPTLRDLDQLAFGLSISWEDEDDVFMKRLDALLADPQLSALRGLVIGKWFGQASEAAPTELYQRLIEHGPRLTSLKGLFFGDVVQEESEISWLHQGDVAPLLHALPQLEEFVIRGGDGLRFKDLRHPNLRALTVQTGGLSAEAVRDIVSAELPELRQLTLWLGEEGYGGTSTPEDLAPLLAGARFPKLEHLGLQDSEHADAIASALSAAPVLARLKGLDLSMGTLGDAGAEALLSSLNVRRLAHLNLRYHYISPSLQAKLSGLGIPVDLSDAQSDEESDDDDDDDRYVEVSE